MPVLCALVSFYCLTSLFIFSLSKLILDSNNPPAPGKVLWRSPSNIALIKYWGKHGLQLPKNPSLSLTLAASCTDMQIEYEMRRGLDDGQIDFDFFFQEEKNEAFKAKIAVYLQSLLPAMPFLKQLKMTIRTGNSFPHSAGIASSASSMSALALCLCSMEDRFFGTLKAADDFDRRASMLARLGSGSACRSIFPHVAVWGATPSVPGSSDEYAVAVGDQVHEVFKGFHDDILIVSAKEKAVSSRVGHALMDGNPYAEPRYAQARARLNRLLDAMCAGDLPDFGNIVENEALTLHALMMCSNPSYTLMRPGSLAIIEKVRQYRADTGNAVYFTLDAGPNVHLLYPADIVHEVRKFIQDCLVEHCEQGFVLNDWVGEGPEEM